MNTSGSNRNSTANSAIVNSSGFIDPAPLTEFDSSDLMEVKFGDGLPDVEFKPGADFEVDDSLFQSVTMKEDFLDFSLSYADHAYCNAELEAPERSVGGILEVGNEEEIQEDVALFEDIDNSAAVGTDETSLTSMKATRIEESKSQDEGPSEDKKKVAVVKTYNMRSKRLAAADGKGGQQDDASEDKNIQPVTKKRKVEQNKAASIEESSAEDDDDDEVEASDSDEEVTVRSKRGRVMPKKGAATRGKGKGKGRNAKGKKSVKGKQAAKKTSRADSDDDDENEDADEPVTVKNSSKTTAKGKAGVGKRKAKAKKKPETESEEESEVESEESESADEEMEETPVKSGKGNQKRTGKWKGAVGKKRKATKKTATTKAVDESESDKTSSDDVPLQEVKKMNRKKKQAASLKKMKKEDTEESSEEDQGEEGDGNDDAGFVGTKSTKSQGRNRDPILSAFSKSPAVLMTDDSASICSTDDGTLGVRSSSRIKKPNRLYVTKPVGKTNTASQKTDKVTKAKNKELITSNAEAPVAGLDISETTDTDALVIDESSPIKYPTAAAFGSIGKQSLPVAGNEREDQHEAEANEGEYEDEREEEEESNHSGELTVEENQQMTSDSATSQTPEVSKRSARLKMIEEATQEKFKAFRAERERTEAKSEAQKKRTQEKFENDMEREEKPKPAATKVAKDAPAKQPNVSAVKNPCRGPSCGKASLPGSVYCSDICIQNHALESIRLIEQERQKSQPQRTKSESGANPVLSKSDERIVVFERKTGKLLTGPVAPTESTLLSWLKKHPTFEVLQPSSHSPGASFNAKKDKKPEKKVPAKEIKPPVPTKTPAVSASQQREPELPAYSGSSVKEDKLKTVTSRQHDTVPEHSKPVSVPRGFPKTTPSDMTGGIGYSRGGPDPARISIRNTLRETLFVRANETDDVMLSGPEIKRLALDIEQELFAYYAEVNTKYKHKYRTLITHLKDPTNKGLFRKVLFGEIKPNRLVRLSSDSLGSRELAYWKDPNAKVKQDKSFEVKAMKKTEFVPKSPYYDPSYDFLSSIIVDTTPQHGNHFFDINCKICTGKIPEPLYYDANKASHVAPKEEVAPPIAIEAEPVVYSKPTKDDERAATIEFSRDPRRSKGGVVTSNLGTNSLTIVTSRTEEKIAILSPPSIVSPIHPLSTDAPVGYQMGPVEPLVLWKGSIYAHDVAKVMVCAYLVSGSLPVLKEDLSDLIVISGRLPPENVYYYLSQIKQSGTFSRDIAIVRFESAGLHDDDLYNQLFSYLNNRDRCGVVSGSSGPTVKDMYIVPVASHAGLPSLLLQSDGPGLDANHPNLLLGVIVKHSYRRQPVAPSPAKPLPAPAAAAPAPAVTSSGKTWMYSERSEMKEELYPESKRSGAKHGTKHIETTAQKSEPVEEYTPLLPTFESKALPTSKSSSASKLSESGNAESSGASDLDDAKDLSEVTRKDPIISKYSKFDKPSRTSTKKRALDDFDDEDKPYDPFDDDDDKKPYDPCSPEFVATTTAITVSTSATASTSSGMPVKYNPSSAAVAPSVVLSPPQSLASSTATSIDLAQVLKPIGGLSYTTDVTAAMLTTLAAISTTTNIEDQRRLLSELTEKINEQQVYLDKQKEDLRNKESPAGLTVSSVTSAGITSTAQSLISSGSRPGQPGFSPVSSSGASSPLYAGASTSASGSGKSQGEAGAASSNRTGTEVIRSGGQSSVLSQIPVDSSAILNLARKRLARKAGEPVSKWEPAPPVSVAKSDPEPDAEKLTWATDSLQQNAADTQTGKKQETVIPQSSFSCNLSVLPLSVQQLLSGSSFENLKSIVANVTAKKTSDGGGQSVESSKMMSETVDVNVQVKSDSEARLVRASSGEEKEPRASAAKSDDKDTKPDSKNIFASNRHGDVDYRLQSASDAPPVSKGFNDIPSPSLSHVTPFPGYSGPDTLQYPDSRAQFPNPAAFGSSGPGLMGPGPAHLMLRPPSDPARFRPSMQALLETPSDPVSKGPSEMKPALLKTPEMPTVSEIKNQEFADMNRGAPSTRPMQHPPFPPDMSRPPFPVDMQRPSFLSDMEKQRPSFSAESQGPQLKAGPFPPQMPKPPLLPDIPQPPFPPQVPRPPFPPGMQRPPFMPEMPRPPFMPEMPRICIPPYKGRGSSEAETHPNETANGSIHSEMRLSTPGLLPVPKQLDPAGNRQGDLSSPSDRYFAAKSMQRGNTLAPRTESTTSGDASKPFSVGDFLKQLDNSRNQPPVYTSHSTKDSKQTSNNLRSPASSDDAAHRERKVLLPTPKVESMQKNQEKSHDIKRRKTDEPKANRSSDDRKQKPQVNKKPDGLNPSARRWSAKSDWEKNSADKASSSDGAAVIVIDETMEKDSVEMIPLPPGPPTVDKADGGKEAEVEIVSYNAAGVEEKSADGHRSTGRSSQDRSRRSGSADRSRSRSRRDARKPSDFHSRNSDRGHRRSDDRHRRSRSKERSDVGQVNQRGRRRSRERFSSRGFQPRSRERRPGVDHPPKRPLRDQRHSSPSADPRKREEDAVLQMRNRNQDNSLNRSSTNSSDQPNFERSAPQSNRPLQGNVICGDDRVPTKSSSIPSLIDMMEQPPDALLPKPVIPSLLDIMGVSRESVSQSGRGGPDSKQNSNSTSSTTSGTADMNYRRDFRRDTDPQEGDEHGRTSFAKPPEFSERNLSFSGSRGRPDVLKQKDVEGMQPSESRGRGRHPPPGGHGDFRRPERFPFEKRGLMEERQASPMDMGAGPSYADSGNTFGRLYPERTGPPKRPLIDKPPERDFERPQFGSPMPNMIQEEMGSRGNLGPGENVTNMPDIGYRPDERFGVGFPSREEGRHIGGFGPDGGQMLGDFPRMRPFPSHFPPELNPEKQMYGAGPGGPNSASMMSMEVDESGGRFSHPLMLKRSLLGDYPGTTQEPEEETPAATGHFESLQATRGEEFGRERNVSRPDERHMGGRPPLMPEPYHATEGKPEPRHNFEGRQTPPRWSPDVMGDGASEQPRLLNMRFPSNMQGIRPGYGLVPPQRPPPASFGERSGFSQRGAGPRVRMPPPEFGRAPEHVSQFSGGHESQPPRHNPVLIDRLPENSSRQFPSAGMEGPPEGMDGISEKKTLLPVPPMPGPHLTEMGVRMGQGPRQLMPSRMDGPMFMARPGMRMPPRFPPHRPPMGFSEGPLRQPGLRQQAPGDPRPRGPPA